MLEPEPHGMPSVFIFINGISIIGYLIDMESILSGIVTIKDAYMISRSHTNMTIHKFLPEIKDVIHKFDRKDILTFGIPEDAITETYIEVLHGKNQYTTIH